MDQRETFYLHESATEQGEVFHGFKASDVYGCAGGIAVLFVATIIALLLAI